MANGSEVESALYYRTTAARMFHDPDLSGDMLLLCLGILDMVCERDETGRKSTKEDWLLEMEAKISKGRLANGQWIKFRIGGDVPRYEPDHGSARQGCGAPMIRRDTPCGKSGSSTRYVVRPDGHRAATVVCSRHREWLESYARAAITEWQANGSPQPKANTGGMLPRYFKADWDAYYRWAAPWRMDNMQAPPLPATPRPTLRLIQGEVSDPS